MRKTTREEISLEKGKEEGYQTEFENEAKETIHSKRRDCAIDVI